MKNSPAAKGTLVRLAIAALAILPSAALAAADPTHPLGQTTLQEVIGRLLGVVLGYTGILTLVVFIWSGFSWMIAAGNADKIKLAKRNMIYAVSGMVVCFGSYAILRFVFNVVVAGVRQ